MASAGVRIEVLSKWMGHSSITITIDRYTHLYSDDVKEQAGKFNDYIAIEYIAIEEG